MKEKIMDILNDLRSDIDYENEKKLIDEGVFDSFDILSLVGELNEEFDIDINVNYLLPENFNSVDDMYKLVRKLQNEI
jgi:acyl carrier protein